MILQKFKGARAVPRPGTSEAIWRRIHAGRTLRNLRKEKSITLAQLSEQTNLSAGYLSQVERGIVDPSLSSLRKIATALDVPPMLLMDDPFSKNLTLHRHEQPIIGHPGSTTVKYTIRRRFPPAVHARHPGAGFTLTRIPRI